MRRLLVVFFIAWFRIGTASDLLDDALSCVINEIQENCFTDVHSAFVCILDSSCELDVDKACGDLNDALTCSANAGASDAVCSLRDAAQRSEFEVWLQSLESLRDSVCSDGLISDLIRREDNISCWDSDFFEGCIFNQLRIKHIADLLNPQHGKTCFDLLISSTSCGVLSMRRHGYCSQNADLPVHLVKRFFGRTPCGQSDWIWNTPYHTPNPDMKTIDAAALTDVTDSVEFDVLPTSDTARFFGPPEEGPPSDTEMPPTGSKHSGVDINHSEFAVTIISGISLIMKYLFLNFF